MSTEKVSKKEKGNGILTNIRHSLYYMFIYIFYVVFYREKDGGYFVKKRLWLFILLTPVIAPFFMLNGLIQYWQWITTYYMAWIECEKQKLTLKQKIELTDRLI